MTLIVQGNSNNPVQIARASAYAICSNAVICRPVPGLAQAVLKLSTSAVQQAMRQDVVLGRQFQVGLYHVSSIFLRATSHDMSPMQVETAMLDVRHSAAWLASGTQVRALGMYWSDTDLSYATSLLCAVR